MTKSKYFNPILLFVASLLYYLGMYSRDLTWIFTGGDAGDWLTQLNWWMVPQATGSPLFISAIHLVSFFPFGTDVDKLTIFFAVIPSAVIVSFTYLIALELTKDKLKGLVAALIVLGAAISLSQATIIEQYAFVAMLIMIAYYCYLKQHMKLTLLFIGLATAAHIIGLAIAFVWLIVEYKRWQEWLKLSYIYIIAGILPYALILWLMAADTPKIMTGYLSWDSINVWLGNPSGTINLAASEFPQRLIDTGQVLLMSLGLAVIPLFKIGKLNKNLQVAVVIAGFCLWFHITNIFFSTWKWLAIGLPAVAALSAVGLTHLGKKHLYAVAIGAFVLICVNPFLFNTNNMAQDNPLATEYYEELMALPDGSGVLTPRGGPYGFALFYAISEGKDLIPLALLPPDEDSTTPEGLKVYGDYLTWLNKEWGITGSNCIEITQDTMAKGKAVYLAYSPDRTERTMTLWGETFITQDTGKFLAKVVEVNDSVDWSEWSNHEDTGS